MFIILHFSFDKLPNGKFGPLQKHGGLHYGDVLFEINDKPLFATPYSHVMRVLNDGTLARKVVKFMNAKDYYNKK